MVISAKNAVKIIDQSIGSTEYIMHFLMAHLLCVSDCIKARIFTVIRLSLPRLTVVVGGWLDLENSLMVEVGQMLHHSCLYSSMCAKWEVSTCLPLLPPRKNKIPDRPIILSQSLIKGTIRLVCWCSTSTRKMFLASLQRTLNRTRQVPNSPCSFQSYLVTTPNFL